MMIGALVGVLAGIGTAVVSLPAANIWIRNPGYNDMFEGHYAVLFSVAAVHGLLCGIIMGRMPQRSFLGSSVFGGIIGLTLAVLMFFGWTFSFSVYIVLFAPVAEYMPVMENSRLVLFWSMFVAASFYSGIYLQLLAIPSIFHGIMIGVLTDKAIDLLALNDRYR